VLSDDETLKAAVTGYKEIKTLVNSVSTARTPLAP